MKETFKDPTSLNLVYLFISMMNEGTGKSFSDLTIFTVFYSDEWEIRISPLQKC